MLDSLQLLKNDFAIKFGWLLQDNISQWRDAQIVAQKSLYSLKSLWTYTWVGLLGFIPARNEGSDYSVKFHCILAIVIFICMVIANIHVANKQYQNKIKATLFPKLLKIFGDKIFYVRSFYPAQHEKNWFQSAVGMFLYDKYENLRYKPQYEEEYIDYSTISNSEIEDCQVFDFEIEHREDDDCIVGEYKDVQFQMNETDFGVDVETRNGKQYQSKFKGLVMRFKLNKTLKSRVLIHSKKLFTKVPKHFEKVNFEYEKFNKKYNVYTDSTYNFGEGQIEARYLLNVAFMERLMQIQTSFRVNKMVCSVYGDTMLIFLYTKRDLFEMNHLLGKIDDVKQYDNLFEEFGSVLSFIDILGLYRKTKL